MYAEAEHYWTNVKWDIDRISVAFQLICSKLLLLERKFPLEEDSASLLAVSGRHDSEPVAIEGKRFAIVYNGPSRRLFPHVGEARDFKWVFWRPRAPRISFAARDSNIDLPHDFLDLVIGRIKPTAEEFGLGYNFLHDPFGFPTDALQDPTS